MSNKVIVIFGSTGVGKSKLGIDIASSIECGAEIVNMDSMQIYEGLDVATNKPTEEEQNQIPHHLFGHVHPLVLDFHVGTYVEQARNIIQQIHERNRVPILIGGTHYYLMSLLWEGSLKTNKNANSNRPSLILNDQPLWDQLNAVDPIMAEKLHKNDHRKITRSLKLFYENEVPHSELILSQSSKLRYDCCFLWVDCKLDILSSRLNDRVDQMMVRGLLPELIEICDLLLANGHTLDYSKGILQAIGAKEFSQYIELVYLERENVGSIPKTEFDKAEEYGIDQLKLKTIQYARKQQPWIRNKLLPKHGVYQIPAHDISQWDRDVLAPALEICKDFLQGKQNDEHPWFLRTTGEGDEEGHKLKTWQKYTCDICNKTVNGDLEWKAHLKSVAHRRKNKFHKMEKAETLPTLSD